MNGQRANSLRAVDQDQNLRIVIWSGLLPGIAHFVILLLAMFSIVGPAASVTSLLSGNWSVPILWAFVIGGPLMSVLASLIQETGHRSRSRLDRICGGAGVVLLILNLVSCVPFPFIFAFSLNL